MTETSYSIGWRPLARDDLRAIVRYISKENPARAKSFVQELQAKTLLLVEHPEVGKRGRPRLPDWLRELVVHPNYIVFFIEC